MVTFGLRIIGLEQTTKHVYMKLAPTTVCHSRILVLHGIPKHLKPDYVKKVIQKSLDKIGGIFLSELFVPSIEAVKDSRSLVSVGQNNSGFAVVEFRVARKIDQVSVL